MDECIREIHAANDAAGFWEQLYRGKDSIWKDTANPLLAETAQHLAPGHALGLGCGERRPPLARHPRMARHRSPYRPQRLAAPQRVAAGPGGQTATVTDTVMAIRRLA